VLPSNRQSLSATNMSDVLWLLRQAFHSETSPALLRPWTVKPTDAVTSRRQDPSYNTAQTTGDRPCKPVPTDSLESQPSASIAESAMLTRQKARSQSNTRAAWAFNDGAPGGARHPPCCLGQERGVPLPMHACMGKGVHGV